VVLKILPWVAIGGLFYLMAQNAGKVKSANATSSAGGGTIASSCGGATTDFGVTGNCWSC
jgi:hypothetical protein